MEQTTRIELTNQSDLVAVRLGVMKPEDVRRLTIEDALVDTGATGLCLPAPLIEQLISCRKNHANKRIHFTGQP